MNLIVRRRLCFKLLPVLILFAGCNLLQAAARAPVTQQQSGQAATAPESDAPNPAAQVTLSLSDQVVQDVLEPLRAGVEGQNADQVMSLFDRQATGYAHLKEQLRAFFQMYSQVRFRYQILQATADKVRGSATAELDMDALPYDVTQVAVRRSVQMRLQMKLTAKGWKVVAFTPADFFSAEPKAGEFAQ